MHISAVLEEELHNSCVTDHRRPLQRCIVFIVTSVHTCAVLEEELHNVQVAILRCQPQREFVISMQACTRSKKQLHRLDLPAPSRTQQGRVHYAPTFAVNSLQQDHAVLVYASCHHGLDHSHVAPGARPHKAIAGLGVLENFSSGRFIPPAGVLLFQAAPGDTKALCTHDRRASSTAGR